MKEQANMFGGYDEIEEPTDTNHVAVCLIKECLRSTMAVFYDGRWYGPDTVSLYSVGGSERGAGKGEIRHESGLESLCAEEMLIPCIGVGFNSNSNMKLAGADEGWTVCPLGLFGAGDGYTPSPEGVQKIVNKWTREEG